MFFHTLVFLRATDACSSVSSTVMETWDSARVEETDSNPEDCILSGLPHSYKQDNEVISESFHWWWNKSFRISGVFPLPERLYSCCDTPATPAGCSVTSPLHWLWLHTPPPEWGLQFHIVAFWPCWLLSVCSAVAHFWEQQGCDWARPPRSAQARALSSASGNPFCHPDRRPAWLYRYPEGSSTLSHSNEPRMDSVIVTVSKLNKTSTNSERLKRPLWNVFCLRLFAQLLSLFLAGCLFLCTLKAMKTGVKFFTCRHIFGLLNWAEMNF